MNSIRNRILLALFGAGLLPLMFVFLVTKTITSHGLEQSERDKLSAVGTEISRQISSVMNAATNDLEGLRSNPFVVGPNTPLDQRLSEMRRLVQAYDSFTDITLYDADGIMVKSTTTETTHPEPVDRTTWLEKARDEGIVCMSTPHRVLGNSGLHMKVYIPIYIQDQSRPSIMKARLTFGLVWDLIDGVHVGDKGEMVLIDSHGKILASKDKHLILEKFDERFPTEYWRENREGTYVNPEGRRFAYSAQVLTPLETRVEESWIVLSLLPEDELTAVLRTSESYQYLVAAAALIITTVVGLLLSNRLAKPVVLASEAAQRVSHGDLETNVPEIGPLEMRRLAASFNQMIQEVKDSRNRLESLVDSRTRKLKESQRNLEALTSQLRATYESTREAILVAEPDGTILAANKRIWEFFGLEEKVDLSRMNFDELKTVLSHSFQHASGPESRWSFFEESADGIGEAEWEIANPIPRILSVYTAPVNSQRGDASARLWMFGDITEQRQLQQGLQQAQKLEAVGRLAGGVAHDFNNLLTGIIGNISLAQVEREQPGGGEPDRFIASARKASQRAADLVKQLLGFSRRSHLQLAACRVGDLVTEVQDLLQHTIDPRIQLDVDLADNGWQVNADATQIQQVLMNLCVNAIDAMRDSCGRVTLSTRNVELTEEDSTAMPGAVPGPYVCISVEDNGHGMPKEVREKIFEPFFTTKAPGKGTGLGLATSYGIVSQHGGWITCESELGKGTTFHVYLPRTESAEEAATTNASAPALERGTETVLIVDDEDVVRAVAEAALKRHGYKVVSAGDGVEALELCREKGDELDVVILDLTMPKLSGRDTFSQLNKLDHPLPVIICSGYLVDLDAFASETGKRPAGFVQKPFNLDQLAAAVRHAVEQQAAAA